MAGSIRVTIGSRENPGFNSHDAEQNSRLVGAMGRVFRIMAPYKQVSQDELILFVESISPEVTDALLEREVREYLARFYGWIITVAPYTPQS